MECHEYFKATSRRISFEYTLLAGVNDSPKQVGVDIAYRQCNLVLRVVKHTAQC